MRGEPGVEGVGGGKGKEMGGQLVSGGQVCIAKGGKKVSGKKGLPPVPLYTPRLSSRLPLKG